MSQLKDSLYEAQGRFNQICIYIDAGCHAEATAEAKDGIAAIGNTLESVGYMPKKILGSDVVDRLYEVQGRMDQTRVYLESGYLCDARMEADECITAIGETLKEVGYIPQPFLVHR